MGRFKGKTAVITGGTSGIGLQTAKAFLDEGARIVITGRDEKALQAARLELGPAALALRSDAGKPADLDGLADAVRSHLGGRVDALFFNAGIAKFAPAEATTEALWDETLDINVKGAFFTTQKLLPFLQSGSAIVFNTSVVDVKGFPGAAAYAASKAALRSLVRTLAAELVGRGIRVNAVSPGPIVTPILKKSGLGAEELGGFTAQMTASNPMKRFGTPEEIARAVLFLASSESSYTTGVELPIDGGLSSL